MNWMKVLMMRAFWLTTSRRRLGKSRRNIKRSLIHGLSEAKHVREPMNEFIG